MRLLKALFALLFIAFGVLFGALNRQAVRIELGFTGIDATVGTALLLAVLAGALLAGAVLTAGVIWPLRLRRKREAPAPEPPAADVQD
ncbi:MAG TPA: lipopolysaccharide assembly protein LapA domain-containing protein [Arenimonas sp.]|uniref:lipopolysaccharide assembly protein LapA domain-containing protein n=1 Tax=Arenimonas sp. TaxID=1872635 RepID=UPI002D7F7066|nr:lipopolysaccharide assembly protein LapA domain-containing protein [Arenimonas sp.]HEU0153604.1 lipopolysaccharide assembly protein LapA domain-containing protein [Arenimonas sp.]